MRGHPAVLRRMRIHEDADGEICIVHTVEDEKARRARGKRRKTVPLTPIGEDELEKQASVQRAVKNTVYAALKELTGKRISGKPDRHPPDTVVLRAVGGRAG